MPHSADVSAELLAKLGKIALFSVVSPERLAGLAADLQWFSVPGGEVVFRQGDADTSLYVVLSGRLGAFIRGEDGEEVFVRAMSAGETVGELAVLSKAPRSATVIALRDTEVVRLPQAVFDRFLEEHPLAVHSITALLVRRLQRGAERRPLIDRPRTVAIVRAAPAIDVAAFTADLAKALDGLGLRTLVVGEEASAQPLDWFHRVEEAHDLVLYVARGETGAWRRHCLRQADRVVLVADAGTELRPDSPAVRIAADNPRKTPIELVLYRERAGQVPAATTALVDLFAGLQHHHVAAREARDFRRLARMISGKAVGIVFSGGGARGFAHIGVLQAIRQAGIEVDLFGGTSMGAIVAAAAAVGWDDAEILVRMRESFVETNPLGDYTLPLVSLSRGARAAVLFTRFFGDRRMEECPYPCYCVSTNLTTGRQRVHRTGLLRVALLATTAIPGVMPPVIEAGSEILIDGAMLNNLPVDVMLAMRRGRVIAVDVTSSYALRSTVGEIHGKRFWELIGHARKGTPNILRLLMAATGVGSYAQTKLFHDQVDLLVEPRLGEIGMLDWSAFDRAIELGRRQTLEALEAAEPGLFA